MANSRLRDESVFSPPDSRDRDFHVLFLGRTWNETPSLNGSSVSIKSKSASPPPESI